MVPLRNQRGSLIHRGVEKRSIALHPFAFPMMCAALNLSILEHPIFAFLAEIEFQNAFVGIVIVASTAAYLVWLIKRKL